MQRFISSRFLNSATLAAITVLCPTIAVAEVRDKEPTPLILSTWTFVFILGAFLLSRWKTWAPFGLVPVASLFALGLSGELLDPYVGPAILREAGLGYVTQAWVAICICTAAPFFFAVLSLRQNPASNH